MDVQQLFKDLRKEAECPLCLETVKDPRTLPCLHSFCLPCLDKHANYARRQLQTAIKCPVCQASFQIPEEDTFGSLPASFHLNRLVDLLALRDGSTESQKCGSCEENNTATHYCFGCLSFLCATCFEAHQRIKATRGHRNISVENLQADDVEELIHRPVMCSEQYHQDQPLEYYCKDCNVCTCIKCSVVSHNRHTMVDMQKAADEQKMQIDEALKKMKAEVVFFENEIEEQTALIDKNKTQISVAREKMNETVDDYIRLLTEKKAIMNARFDEINQAHQKAYTTHLESFLLAVTQLKSSLEQGENILERNINAEILRTKPVIMGRCEDLLKAEKPKIYKPPHVYYVVEDALEQDFDDSDRVVVSHTDPSSTNIERLSQKVKEQNETHFTIITRDSEGRQCYNKDDLINCKIRPSTGDSSETELDLEDNGDGSYLAEYTPSSTGLYDLKIEVNGKPLVGSPWSVQVIPHQYRLKFSFGSNGSGPGQFNGPYDIAVSKKTGTIAVSDYENKRIQLFDSKGHYLREIGLRASCTSLDFTESGQIIANTPGNVLLKISLFSEEGQFVKRINSKYLKSPFCLSTDDDDDITVCDEESNEVTVISHSGKELVTRIAASEREQSVTYAIFHNCTGCFFVSDSKADLVRVFNGSGNFLYEIGRGQLLNPVGLAIDKFNNLIVCDTGNKRLKVFSTRGDFLSETEQYFHTPYFVAVSNEGDVLVPDYEKNCVVVFQ
ncbi:E3 ubiquitin-protein ligase TRIM71-like [Stylophora pistillata]|nr:E3 ubiquitin-protein ligase TRIM71-like [Stylophora pistillata]